MKKKSYMVLTLALLAGTMWGEDTVEWLKRLRDVDAVEITSTNVLIRFKTSGLCIMRDYNPLRWGNSAVPIRRTERDVPLILTTDEKSVTLVGKDFGTLIFEPAAFKNQQKGFRVSTTKYVGVLPFGSRVPDKVMYLALSDTPIQVGEEDFEGTIWIPKREDGVQFLERLPWIEASVTSAGLTLKLELPDPFVEQGGIRRHWSVEEMKGYKYVALASGQDAKLAYERPGGTYHITFEPVSFKNQLEGFKITAITDSRAIGNKVTTNAAYIALSDTSVRVGEIDVAGVDEAAVIRREKQEAEAKERADKVRIFLGNTGFFDSILGTSTNLSLQLSRENVTVEQNGKSRQSSEYIANRERLILTPSQETRLVYEQNGIVTTLAFTPVSLKNQQKGFKFTVSSYNRSFDRKEVLCTAYIALGDTPMLVGKEDVLEIM
ncbi:MAG: hypothetical protein FWH21_05840 [Kiritimatiellaeota bacterium]|nr:hypothetical protein [Kiritimatiellota bacterium]